MAKIQVAKVSETNLDLFLWRTQGGDFLPPQEMATSHLFYTLRMIWNHSAPKRYQIRPYKPYTFSEYYTPIYMRTAVRALTLELIKRKDLAPELKEQLDIIYGHLNPAERVQ